MQYLLQIALCVSILSNNSLVFSMKSSDSFDGAVSSENNYEYLIDNNDKNHPFNQAYDAISQKKDCNSFKEIIEKNLDIINAQGLNFKKTLLHHAVLCQNISCVDFLLKKKADITIEDESENTALRNVFANQIVNGNKDLPNYTILTLFSQHLTKKSIQSIIVKKNSYKNDKKKYNYNNKIVHAVLKYINSKGFVSKAYNLKTAFLCFKYVEKKYKFSIPKPIKKSIVFGEYNPCVSEVFRMKLAKQQKKSFLLHRKKNLTEKDFTSK